MVNVTEADIARASNSKDPSSLSNPDVYRCTHLDLSVTVSFSTRTIFGTATFTCERQPSAPPSSMTAYFDAKDLLVKSVSVNGRSAEHSMTVVEGMDEGVFGRRMEVTMPKGGVGTFEVKVEYSTTPKSSAIQWLPPSQTLGKVHPYLFTQCQAIHARTLLPCQDAPAVKLTYSASVTVDSWATCLMSALSKGSTKSEDGGKTTWHWEQPVPTSTYLIAICVGDLASRDISDRCRVWSEPGIVDAVAFEFSETEEFLKTAEDLTIPYMWGRYDVVCLPPSFPYGGMENPCLTFVTPTLLAGDRSLADVVAHEIAHSWTGNLVTNGTWEHFWLNEGWTTWLQRRIMGRMKNDPKFFDFDAIGGWKHLTDDVALLPEDFSRLVPVIGGCDPDDAFSGVPYEKGFNLLVNLERRVGEEAFGAYAKTYLTTFKFITVTSTEFRTHFTSYFKGHKNLKDFDWDTWFHSPGLPATPTFDRTLSQASEDLAAEWLKFDSGKVGKPTADTSKWTTNQRTCFLDAMLVSLEDSSRSLNSSTTRAMDSTYGYSGVKNSEILHRFSLLCINAEDRSILEPCLKFITTQGRMKFVRPIYRALYGSKMGREVAVKTFKENMKFYHPVAAKMVAKDMGLGEDGESISEGAAVRAVGFVIDNKVVVVGIVAVIAAFAIAATRKR